MSKYYELKLLKCFQTSLGNLLVSFGEGDLAKTVYTSSHEFIREDGASPPLLYSYLTRELTKREYHATLYQSMFSMEDNNLEKYLREMYKDDNIRTRAIEVIKKEKDAGHIRSSSEGDMNGSGLLIVFSTYRPIIENGIIVGISYYDVVPKEQHVLAWNNKGYFIDSSYKISFNLLDFRKIPVLGFVEVEKNKVNVTKP